MDAMANSCARLKTLLRRMQYPHLAALDLEAADVGDLLRILHFALLDFSRAVAAAVQRHGFDLYGKTDARFVDCAFRLLRDAFKYFPALSAAQFLSAHYRRRKLELVADVLQLVLAEHDESARLRRRQAAVWSQPTEANGAAPRVERHLLPLPPTPTLVQQRQPLSHAAAVLQLQLLQRSSRHASAQRAARGASREARGGQQQVALGRDDEDEDDDDDDDSGSVGAARAGSSPPLSVQPTCACVASSAELTETLAALSSQVAGLASAFAAKLSSVEERLSRLETQVQTLATPSDARKDDNANVIDDHQQQQQWSQSEAASRLQLQLEARSWPPRPSAFARP